MTLAPERRETAKERSLRIPLDYLQRPDRLVRVKWQLGALLVLLAAGYVAALALFPRWGRGQASPGALSAAHHSFHDDCRACHQQPLVPLRSDAVDLAHWRDPLHARQAAERGCLRCHEVHEHHASAPADEVPRCAACHREHRGTLADLRRTDDRMCTRCHAQIARHRQGDSRLSPALVDVTAFAGGESHPAFRSLAAGDPGNVRFNHWLHLQPGVAPAASQRKLRREDLPPADRLRYAARADGLVQLACADCHQPDPRTDGAAMRSIAYAQHCQACHPLHVAVQPDGPPLALPHGTDRATLAALVDGLLVARSLAQLRMDATPPAANPPTRRGTDQTASSIDDLPLVAGRTLGRNLAQRLATDLLRQRTVALRAVAGRCLQCHTPRLPATGSHPEDDVALPDGLTELPELAPAAIPSRWLVHARFDHSAHRHVACRECHAAAYRFERPEPTHLLAPPAGDARFIPARDADEVMIADRDTCLRCHAPRQAGQGGARRDCSGCHDYHGGTLRVSQHALPPAAARHELLPLLPTKVTLRAVSRTKAQPSQPTYVDERSCAASGCHGSTHADAWPSARAATTWLSRDPHREASELLWTERARQITAHLAASPASPRGDAPPIDRKSGVTRSATDISDDQHSLVLAQRCVACHAVPADGPAEKNHLIEANNIGHTITFVWTAAGLGGVGCQACHGPASGWLHTHYRKDFGRTTSGFVDTKTLSGRAAVCMPCHVGPATSGDRPAQAVDHDLIAAGHPRLAFDFFGYFESLPAHWDRRRDQGQQTGFYAFALWQAGHQAQVAQEARLSEWFTEASRRASQEAVGVPEFSTVDCQACHHWLTHPIPRPMPAGLWRPRVASLSLGLAEAAASHLDERLEAAAKALETIAVEALTYDTACRMYSLVRAVAADLSAQAGLPDASRGADRPAEPAAAARQALASALNAAGAYLARECFPAEVWQSGGPTIYDGPATFTPAAWSSHRDALAAALREVRQSLKTRVPSAVRER